MSWEEGYDLLVSLIVKKISIWRGTPPVYLLTCPTKMYLRLTLLPKDRLRPAQRPLQRPRSCRDRRPCRSRPQIERVPSVQVGGKPPWDVQVVQTGAEVGIADRGPRQPAVQDRLSVSRGVAVDCLFMKFNICESVVDTNRFLDGQEFFLHVSSIVVVNITCK